MEDVSNSCADLGVVAEVSSTSDTSRSITSDTSRSITFDKDCLFIFRIFVINSGLDWSETEAAHAAGIQGPGLKDGSFGSSWSVN